MPRKDPHPKYNYKELYPNTYRLAEGLTTYVPAYKKYTPEQFVDMLQLISNAETKNQNIAQMGGGPGRGYYQMEKRSSAIAKKRAENINNDLINLGYKQGIVIPNFNKDFTKLSKDDQGVFVLSNMIKAASSKRATNPNAYVNPLDPKGSWVQFHWAGSAEDKPAREEHWDKVNTNTEDILNRFYNDEYSAYQNKQKQNALQGVGTKQITSPTIMSNPEFIKGAWNNTQGGWLDKFDDGGDVPSDPLLDPKNKPTIYRTKGGSHYDPIGNTIYFNPLNNIWNPAQILKHEGFHWAQNMYGDLQYPELYPGPLRRPQTPINPENPLINEYYNRADSDNALALDYMKYGRNVFLDEEGKPVIKDDVVIPSSPSLQFIPDDVIWTGVRTTNRPYNEFTVVPGARALRYSIPNSIEGEAKKYEDTEPTSDKPIMGIYGAEDIKHKHGGMIKRADGSYSRRGLWDNIRANSGSGKKPTAEMLRQERKIKKYAEGSIVDGGGGGVYPPPTAADSLVIYNNAVALKNFYDNEVAKGRLSLGDKTKVSKNFKKDAEEEIKKLKKENEKFYNTQINYRKIGFIPDDPVYLKYYGYTPQQIAEREKEGLALSRNKEPYKAYYRDVITPAQNLGAPYAILDSRITPQYIVDYGAIKGDYPGGLVSIYSYDPLAVKPAYLRSDAEQKEWEKKYGNPPHPKEYIDPIKPKTLEDVKQEFLNSTNDFTDELKPISKVDIPVEPVRKVMNPDFDWSVDTLPNRTKDAVVDALGHPRYKYYNNDKVISEQDYNQLKGFKEGSWVADSSIPTPTSPSYYEAGADRTLTNYQMGTPKARMYGGGGGVNPIYVTDPNDPRLKAYNDSSALYNNYINLKNTIVKGGKFYPTPEESKSVKSTKTKKFSISNPNNPIIYKQVLPDFGYNVISDKGLPEVSIISNKNIQPVSTETYTRKESKYKSEKDYNEAAKKIKDFNEKQGEANWIGYDIQKYVEPKQTVKLKKYWTEKDVNPEYWKKFKEQYPDAIGIDPDHVDKNDNHLPVYDTKLPPKPPINIQPIIAENQYDGLDLLPQEEKQVVQNDPIFMEGYDDIPPVTLPSIRMELNPKFNPGRGISKEAVVDELGNPKYKYWYNDGKEERVVGEHEYNKLKAQLKAQGYKQGGPVMYNAGSTVWTKQDTPLWVAGTPTPTSTQHFKNDRSINTNRYRIGDVVPIPNILQAFNPSAGTHDYNQDVQPYPTRILHAPDTTRMEEGGPTPPFAPYRELSKVGVPQVTQLTPAQEIAYQRYKQSLGDVGGDEDYDLRGFWKEEGFKGLTDAGKNGAHFTDKYKILNLDSPYREYNTLSDQSKYASEFDRRGQGYWVPIKEVPLDYKTEKIDKDWQYRTYKHGSYVKKHINSPRVYGSPINPSGMTQGPSMQRGVMFAEGSTVGVDGNNPSGRTDLQYDPKTNAYYKPLEDGTLYPVSKVSIQNPDGSIKQVWTDSDEYKQKYGNLMTYNPTTEMFQGKTFEPVEVTAQAPDTYNNYMLRKHRNDGLAGAMFGMPLDYVFGFPQAAMTKLFTGKYQTPSEAMDIQNPVGSFLVDAVADPANLVGAGLFSDIDKVYNASKLLGQGFKDVGKGVWNIAREHGQGMYDAFSNLPSPRQIANNLYRRGFQSNNPTLIQGPTVTLNNPFSIEQQRLINIRDYLYNGGTLTPDDLNFITSHPESQFTANGFSNSRIPQFEFEARTGVDNWRNSGPYKPDGFVLNKSGYTKNDIIYKLGQHIQPTLDNMSEQEFQSTVLTPKGELITHTPALNLTSNNILNYIMGHGYTLPDVKLVSVKDYVKKFNDNISRLNELIASKNTTGIPVKVKELKESGLLYFEMPDGTTKEWHVNINPGEWDGVVQNIPNSEYYKGIPGLSMNNTINPPFMDARPHRGSRLYESFNDFLKELNMGRVKSGFGYQTDYSGGLWEDAINKNKAYGIYGSKGSVHGAMKKLGGYINKYENAGFMNQYNTQKQASGGYVKNTSSNNWLDTYN